MSETDGKPDSKFSIVCAFRELSPMAKNNAESNFFFIIILIF
jgi:hypothetical protein